MARVKCPSCGVENNQVGDSFCGECGAKLAGGSPVRLPEPVPARPVGPAPAGQALQSQKPPVVRAKLVVKKTGRTGQEFVIDQEAVNIGRWDADKGVLPEIDLTNDDPGNYISRRHARIFLRGGEYFIEDMGSMNGTFVNKSPRLIPNSPMKLQNGDEIVMGRTFFAFVVE